MKHEIRRVCLGALVAAASSSFGQTSHVWDGGGTNDLWSSVTNWVGDAAVPNPTTNYIALAGTVRLTPDVNAPWTIFGLIISNGAGAFSLSGSNLTMTAASPGGPTNIFNHLGASNVVINNNIILPTTLAPTNRRTMTIASTGSATFNGSISNNGIGLGDLHIRGGGSGVGTINGRIWLGTNALFHTDVATWVIGGTGNVWGTTLMDQSSTVRIAVSDALPTNTVISFGVASPRIDLDNFNQTIRGMTGTGVVRTGTSAGGTLTISDLGANNTFRGAIVESGSLVKRGAGTFTMAGAALANSYSGSTTVAEGVLLLAKNGGVNNIAAGAVTVQTGAVLRLGADSQIADTITSMTLNQGTLDLQTQVEGITPPVVMTDSVIAGAAGTGFLLTRGGIVADGTNLITKRYSVRAADATSGVFRINTGTTTMSGPIYSDNGTTQGITKAGSGRLVLAAANTFVGNTVVSNGTLVLDVGGSLNTTPNIRVASGAFFDTTPNASITLAAGQTLQGEGTVLGQFLTVGSSRILAGGDGTPGTLTVTGDVIVSEAAYTNHFDLTNSLTIGGGVNDLLDITGTFEPVNSRIRIRALAPLVSGSYRLINYGSGMTSPFTGPVLGNTYRDAWTLDTNTSGQINLTVAVGTNQALVWRPQFSADWDLLTSSNWTNTVAGILDTYADNDAVLFDDVGAYSNVVNIVSQVKPASVVVSSASNYVFTGAGRISDGVGPLTLYKDGAGSLTVALSNDFSGGTVVSNGAVVMPAAGVLGTGPVALSAGATLELAATGTVANVIGGSGTVLKSGAGSVTLAVANTYTGPTIISNGALVVAGPGSLGGGNHAANISNDGALSFNSATQILSGVVSGTGSLTQTGSGQLTLSGGAANTFGGLTTLSGTGQMGLSKTGGVAAVPGDFTMAATGTRAILWASQDNQFAPGSVMRFSGAGDSRFELKGTTQTLAGVDSLGTASVNAFIQHSEFGSNAAVDGTSDLILNGAGSYVFTNYLRNQGGTLNVTKTGSGTQTFTGANITYTGVTVVSSGLLLLSNATAFASAVSNDATVEFKSTAANDATPDWGYGKTLSGTGTVNKTGTGWFHINGGRVEHSGQINVQGGILSGNTSGSTWTNNTASVDVSSGAMFDVFGNVGVPITIGALTGGGIVNNGATPANTLIVGAANRSGTFGGVIRNTNTAALSLTKIGTGTQTLATNTYSGITTISAGTLALSANGSITGTPRIIIATGATFDVSALGNLALQNFQSLEGFGLVTGGVSSATGSKLTPGTAGSPGTLTFGNNLNLVAGTTNQFDLVGGDTTIGGGINDLVNIGGLLEPSNAVVAVAMPAQPFSNATYRLFNYAGTKGSVFNPNIAGNTSRKTWALDEATVGQVNFVVSGGFGNLKWNSQTSTNWALNVGTNWFDIAGGTNTTYLEGDSVLFDDSGAVTNNIALVGTLKPGGVSVNSASNYSITGAGKLSGTTGLTKDGAGTLTLGGTGNDYLGAVVVSGGVIKAAQAGFLGKASGVTILPAGQVNLNGVSQTGSNYLFIVSGSGPDGRGAIVNTNAAVLSNSGVKWLELTGDTTVGALATVAANENGRFDIGLNGGIGGNGFTLTKVGAAPISTRGPATNTQWVVNEGLLYAENVDDAFGSNVTVNAGAFLGGLGSQRVFSVAVTLNGGTLASRTGGGIPTWTGPITLASDSFVNTSAGFGYAHEDIIVRGTISGPGKLTKRGTAALRLFNTNSYAGGTVIENSSNGQLVLASTNGPAVASNVQIGHTNIGGGVAFLYPTNHNQFAPGVALSFKGSLNDWAWLKLFGTTQYIASITSDDNAGGVIDHVYQEGGYNTDSELVLTGPGDSYWSGQFMRDSSVGTSTGKLKLTHSGTGTVTLAGGRANTTFSGGVTVTGGGTLNLKSAYSAGRSTITMNGGTLALDAPGLKEDVDGTAARNLTITNDVSSAVVLWPARAGNSSDVAVTSQYSYAGFIINTAAVPVTWTFAEQFDDQSYLKIDNTVVLNDTANGPHSNATVGTITLAPGLHTFDLRLFNGAGGGGPNVTNAFWKSTAFAVAIDFQGLNVSNWLNFQRLEDNGSGSLLITDVQVTNSIVLGGDITARVSSVWGPTNAINGPISGGFGIIKTGAGTLTLGGTNSYAGPTTIAVGKLFLDGQNTGAGAFTVATNTLLWGTGSAGSSIVTVQNGGQLGPQGTNIPGTFTAGGITLNAGAKMAVALNGTNATHRSLGDVSSSPTVALQFFVSSPAALGTNVIVDYATNYTGSTGDFAFTVPNGGQGEIVNNVSDTRIELVVTNAGLGIKWDGAADAAWKLSGQQNWKTVLSGAATIYQHLDAVLFDDTATGNYSVSLNEPVTPSALTVNGASNYVISGSGKISNGSGQLQLVKDGAGTLTVLIDNDFSGGVLVSNGVVQMGNGGGVGLLGTGALNVAGSGTLTFFRTNNALTINNPLTGAGTVVFKGTGSLLESVYILGGNNTNFTGAMIVTNARINLDNANDLGGPGSTITVQDGGGAFQSTGTFGRPITIAGLGWLEGNGRLGAMRVDTGTWNAPVTLAANARIGSFSANGTVTGPISGPYELEIWSGSAAVRTMTLTPTAPSTYASLRISSNMVAVAGNTNAFSPGPVIMNGGTQRLAGFSFAFSNLSSTAAGGTIENSAATPATFTVGSDGSSTIYGGIFANNGTGPLNVTKVGGGTLTLQGANVNTGIYTITGGTLALAGGSSIIGTPRIVIASGATFDVSALGNLALQNFQSLEGSGLVTGSVTAAAGSKLTPGTAGTPGTLSFGNNLSMNAGTTNHFDLTNSAVTGSSVNDLIAVGVDLFPNSSRISINTLAPLLSGTNTLFTYAGTKTGSFNASVLGINPTRKSWAIDEATLGQVNLVVSGTYLDLKWNAQTSSNWDNNVGVNWLDIAGATNTTFFEADNVLFDDSGAVTNGIELVGTLKPAAVTVNSASNYTFTGGKISGSAGLTKDGAGLLTLGATNDYTGGTIISGGTLRVTTTTALPGSVAISSGATLNYDSGNATYTYANNLSGAGRVHLTFTGATANNVFLTGVSTGFNGTIELTANGTVGSKLSTSGLKIDPAALIKVNSNATLFAVVTTNANPIQVAGTGNSENRGAIRLATSATLNGPVSLMGNTTIGPDGGTINGSISNGVGGAVTLTLGGTTGATSGNFGGTIGDGAGTLAVLVPSATITFTGTNTYTGGTTLNGGALVVSILSDSGDSAIGNSGLLTFGGGTLRYAGTNDATTARAVTNTGASTYDITAPLATLTLGGTISGAGSLTKSGPGTLAVGGTNTYTGATVLNGGRLAFTADNAVNALTFGSAAGSTNISTLDLTTANLTATSLTVLVNNGAANTILIGTGKTLTVTGNVTIGPNPVTLNTTSIVAMAGGGAFNITTGPGGLLQIGGSTISATSATGETAVVNLAGLSSAWINVSTTGTIRINNNAAGSAPNSQASLLLPTPAVSDATPVSTIIAANLNIGDSATLGGGTNQINMLVLGTGLTTLNVSNVNVGTGGRDIGSITFATTNGTLKLRSVDGVSRNSAFNLATGGATTGVPGPNDLVDFRGHSVDLLVGTLNVGNQARVANLTADFYFDTGTLDATGVTIGFRTGTGTAPTAATLTDNLTLGGGTVIIGTGGVDMGGVNNTSTTANATFGTVNISGGTVTVGSNAAFGASIRMGNNTSPTGLASAITALNITGGNVTLAGRIMKGGGIRNTNTITLNGGSLNMQGNVIGGTNAINFLNFQSGTLANVGQINNGASWAKTTAGTLVLTGTNLYSGATFVSNGTLLVNGVNSGLGAFNVTAGTLGGVGSIAGSIRQTGGSVAPGASSGILTVLSGYTNTAGSLDIELAGLVPGSGHDQLAVGGAASLAGTLNVTTNGGFVPAFGNTFTVLTASAVSGTFAATNLPALGGGNAWTVQYLAGAVVLSVTNLAPPPTGYDLAALVITNGLTGIQDDADGDGYANLLEYVTGGSLTNPGNEARMNGTRTNGLLALKFTRDTNTVDATLIVEGANATTNNAIWTGIATNLAGSWGSATNVTETGSNPVTVTAYDTDPSTNRFLRLRVTRP